MKDKLNINGKVLAWSRNGLGMSIQDLASKTKIKTDLLKGFEDGTQQPSFPQLKKIAGVVKRPTALFFMAAVPAEPSIPKDFRVLDESDISKLSPKTVVEIRKAQRKREIAIELAKDLAMEIPTFDERATMSDDPKKLGTKYRRLLLGKNADDMSELSEGDAFNLWKSALEGFGILVFQASLDNLEEMRGLAVYHHQYPLILINTKDSPRGKIFSLLHEFCHLLLHKSGIGNINPNWSKTNKVNPIEVFCNAFAGEAILPAGELQQAPEVISIDQGKIEITRQLLFKISNRFQASWEVVLRKFLELGYISEKSYKTKREEIRKFFESKKKSTPIVPFDQRILNWNGDFFTSLVVDSFVQEKISAKEVTDYLGAKFQHFEKIQKRLRDRDKGA